MSEAVQKQEMAVLLRFIGRNEIRFAAADDGIHMCLALAEPQQQKTFRKQIFEDAVSAGLIVAADGKVHITKEANSYLRRLITKERDEIFQQQHRVSEMEEVQINGVSQKAERNHAASQLLILRRFKDRDGKAFFTDDAAQAGERLATDFYRGQLSPRITASWEPKLSTKSSGSAGGIGELTDVAMAARSRFSKAVQAMGPELSGVAIDVCCFEKGLEAVERERQWPARSAKLMLRTALLMLARHYSPPKEPTHRNSHRWGAPDYRPIL